MRITQQIPYSIRLCQRILCAYNYFLNDSVTETAAPNASYCVAVTLRLFNCSLRSVKTSRLDCRQSRTKLNDIAPLWLHQEIEEFYDAATALSANSGASSERSLSDVAAVRASRFSCRVDDDGGRRCLEHTLVKRCFCSRVVVRCETRNHRAPTVLSSRKR